VVERLLCCEQLCRFLHWFDTQRPRICWWTWTHWSTRWSRSQWTWPRWSWRCRVMHCCCSTPNRDCAVITRCYCKSSRTTPRSVQRSRTSRSRSSTPALRRCVRKILSLKLPRNMFSHRVVGRWNSLDQEMVDAEVSISTRILGPDPTTSEA